MEVISTNIGRPETVVWRGQEVQTGIFKYEVDTPLYLDEEDVVNDHVLDRRYHGGADKACYLYSADHYDFWKNKYPDADWQWGMFGENLTVNGLDESEIQIGDIFQIGEAVVQVSQPRQPCFKLGFRFENQAVVDDFSQLPYPGIDVRVIQAGNVKKGDTLKLIKRDQDSLSVSQVFSLFRVNQEKKSLILKAIGLEYLAVV